MSDGDGVQRYAMRLSEAFSPRFLRSNASFRNGFHRLLIHFSFIFMHFFKKNLFVILTFFFKKELNVFDLVAFLPWLFH